MDPKLLQKIRDKLLGVTESAVGGLNTSIYLQQIRDAVLGVTREAHGNLNEVVYLQQIRNAIKGVPDGQFGSLAAHVYLQEIRDAFNDVTSNPVGSMDEDLYLAEIYDVAVLDDVAPTVAISATGATSNVVAISIVFSEVVTGFVVGDITISAGGSLANFATADNKTFTVDWTLAAGANTMDIAAGVCTDAAGNLNTAATQYAAGFLTIQPDGTTGLDTYIHAQDPNNNFSVATFMWIGERNDGANRYRSFIKFPLTSLPSTATIANATLSLYAIQDQSSNARTYRVYRLKRAWVLAQVTWNNWKSGSLWSTAGAFHVDDCEQTDIGSVNMTATETLNQYKNFVLTPTTKANLDLGNGWLLKADTETDDAYAFNSCNHATANTRPKLVITYYINP